ncbi:MAG TPA: hypothetical protein VGF19_16150 [Candidatus Acidoferrum sp.]
MLPSATQDNSVRSFFSKHGAIAGLLSALLVIPCLWQRKIEAGDLGSHVYNAWLAQLVHEGKAPGIYIVWQSKNILFDLMLFYFAKIFGLPAAEKIAMSLCVLIFFWGVFALVAAVAGKPPWFLAPLVAMFAYGYVFYMGFMNYYLSVGLAAIALALLWQGGKRDVLRAAILFPIIYLAHPLGALWFLGTAAYRLLWLSLQGGTRLALPMGTLFLAIAVHVFIRHHPEYQWDFLQSPIILRNGFDQLAVFGHRYVILSVVLFVFALICIVVDAVQHGRFLEYWKKRRLIVELYLAAFWMTALLPQNLKLDPTAGWIGALVTRLTIINAIFAMCWLASLRPRLWHLVGYGAAAAVFFAFTYQEMAYLNRLEANADRIAEQLPFGTRVSATIYEKPRYRAMFIHAVDRACVGHCFMYSNYEPSTREFRVRVAPGNRVVTTSQAESEDWQWGRHEVRPEDLPMKQIYQCGAADLTQLCIRDLTAGEQNGRIGYHPRPE